MTRPVRVGIIGTGGMGSLHAHNLQEHVQDAELVAVADVDRDRAAMVASSSGAEVFTDGEQLVASETVDAVVVASPDATHASLARACLEARKPVLLEKPVAVDLDEAAGLVASEVELGRRLIQVGLMRRYDPQHVALAERLTSGAVGRPLMFRGWHRNPPEPTPPTSAEILINSAVHDLYSARWLMGQEITEIHVVGTTIHPRRSEHHDLLALLLRMEHGAIGSIEVNKDSGFGYEVGVEITGDAGLLSSPPHHTPIVRRDGQLRQRFEPDWLERFEAAYLIELRAWAAAALHGGAVGPSAWDGYRTLAVSMAGVASLQRAGPVTVENPPRPRLYAEPA
jgi:myo-inositol 2-dehydrogenase / D-chiro-inositol 1-dehydrogenase